MIRIKVRYLDTHVANEKELEKKKSFLVQKKSLLKGGFRGFLLDSPGKFKEEEWFKKLQCNENVEFFIEGSGVYRLVNADLTEGELYFEKSQTPVYSKKCIFVDMPFDKKFKNVLLKSLQDRFGTRIIIDTIEAYTKGKGSVKLDDKIFKTIRSSLLFIADITPLSFKTEENDSKWLANSNVMLELGYAMAVKQNANILITYNESVLPRKNKDKISIPFDIQSYRYKSYTTEKYDGLLDEVAEMLKSFRI